MGGRRWTGRWIRGRGGKKRGPGRDGRRSIETLGGDVGLEISLLGRPGVRRDGVVVAAPRGHKVWGLLAYLMLCGRPVARARVAAVLFPDAGNPLAVLRWNLHELRRLL